MARAPFSGFAALCLFLALALPAGAQPLPIPQRLRESGRLAIGTDATYPPMESLRGEEYVGFDIDLGNAIARELGLKPQWVNSGFDGILPALLTGKFDLVISSVTITEERDRQLDFSDPYYTAGQMIAFRRSGTAYNRVEELRGKRAGIQINTTAGEVLKKVPGIEVRGFNSIDLALLDLQNGNIDAVVADSPVLRYYTHRGYRDLRLSGDMLTAEHYGIVMRPDERELRTAVNAALRRLRDSGELDRINEEWFGQAAQREEVPQQSARELLPTVLPALARAAVTTVELTLLGLLIGLPLGLLVTLLRQTRFPPLSFLAATYVEVLRGTPLLVQIFFIYYVLPAAGVRLTQWPAAALALSLNASAYIAEIFRSGIQSIDRGQMEAARSLGMTYGLAMRLVILPQTFRRVLPPLTNEAIALLKDSSLVSVIAMVELTREGQQLTSQVAAPMLIWPLVGLFYLILTMPLTRLAGALERRWATSRH